jgi:hypothetical protein
MFGDAAEDVTQICFWVQSVELGRPDQTIEVGCPAATVVGTSEEIVASANRDSPDILPMSVKN